MQERGEGFRTIPSNPLMDQGVSDMWTTNSRTLPHMLGHVLPGDREIGTQQVNDLACPGDSGRANLFRLSCQASALGIVQVAEHVYAHTFVATRHFHATHQVNAIRPRGVRRFVPSGDRVVVGESYRRHTTRRCVGKQFRRCLRAVGKSGVSVQIDHAQSLVPM